MILQALSQYYDRLKDNPDIQIPLYGFSREKLHFAIEVDRAGRLLRDLDIRGQIANRKSPNEMIVPAGTKKSVNISPNFLWGSTTYLLGVDDKGKPKRTTQCFEAFKKYQHQMGDDLNDEGMEAVLKFLDRWTPGSAKKLKHINEIIGMNLVFKLEGELKFVHDRPNIKKFWAEQSLQRSSSIKGTCLLTGKRGGIARLHAAIKGVKDAQTSGASIVSFNLEAFTSYNKEQNYNAPIGEDAAFSYTTALNHLLRFDSPQKIQVGDATAVFWSEKESPIEGFLGRIFDPRDESGESPEIRHFLEAVRDGKKPKGIDGVNKFYILGLSPNASRLAVRFWHVSTVEDMAFKIGQHFQDLSIVRSFDSDKEYPGIWWLLKETARNSKDIPPLLAGAVMRSILTGVAYPQTLLSSVIGRIRADGNVNYYRAAIIKACLIRKYRITNQPMEVSMSLNKNSTNAGYRLGRLFAVLEKAQKDAIPGANATIKDRYYGSASATPRVVFPVLLRLAQHHIQKSNFRIALEKDIQEIVSEVQDFPPHLSLDDQGFFALGYYHQKKDIYTKSEKKEETANV